MDSHTARDVRYSSLVPIKIHRLSCEVSYESSTAPTATAAVEYWWYSSGKPITQNPSHKRTTCVRSLAWLASLNGVY